MPWSKRSIAADKKTVPGETDTVIPGFVAERCPVQGKKQCRAASLRRYYPDQVLRVFLSEIAPPASAHPMVFKYEMQYIFGEEHRLESAQLALVDADTE